jgi:hypothetical protein
MTLNGYLQLVLYLVVLLALAKPLGGYPYSDTWVHCQNLLLQNGGFAGASDQRHECLKCPQLVVLQSMLM